MKKQTLFLLTALFSAALFSCNRQDETALQTPPDATGEIPILFTAEGDGLNASVTTKATSAVTSLSSFNVLCVTGTAGSSESTVFNSPFTGSSTYTGGKYWPSTDRSYKFYASNATITSAASGPTVSASNVTDVVCAFLDSPTYKASNELTFNHIFARVGTCTITAPSDYTVSGLTVKITPKTGGTYNLYTGNGKTDGTGWSSTSNGTITAIATSTGSTADQGMYLVPGSYTLSASYTLTKGDYSQSFNKTATVSLLAGKINNISSTLPAGNAADIVFTVSITDWSAKAVTANFN